MINIDGDVVSWGFVELGKLPIVIITSPSDERFVTNFRDIQRGRLTVWARFWSEAEVLKATASIESYSVSMDRLGRINVWQAALSALNSGIHFLRASIEDAAGNVSSDEIRVAIGGRRERK